MKGDEDVTKTAFLFRFSLWCPVLPVFALTASDANANAAATAAEAKTAVYSMLPKVSFVGLRDNSILASRAAIDKAWPKTPKTPRA